MKEGWSLDGRGGHQRGLWDTVAAQGRGGGRKAGGRNFPGAGGRRFSGGLAADFQEGKKEDESLPKESSPRGFHGVGTAGGSPETKKRNSLSQISATKDSCSPNSPIYKKTT